jgi:hypothetical protein
MRIRDGDSLDPGWKKVGSGIWDKHSGSTTLRTTITYLQVGWVELPPHSVQSVVERILAKHDDVEQDT